MYPWLWSKVLVQAPLWQLSTTAPPVHPAVIGYLVFAGVQIQCLSQVQQWSSGTSGIPLSVKKSLLLLFLAQGAFSCMAHSACLVHKHPGSARWLVVAKEIAVCPTSLQ